ncbi:MAG: DUF1837 domain-containing protein [Fimbriimonadaceae bacterium]|nr:DUF1837 domain-containing protein [Fimbriimonadaceae bacterium]
MPPVHSVRVQDLSLRPTLSVLCAGYELSKWRKNQLVEDIFDRHLTSFALSFTEWDSIAGSTAAASLRKAAQAVYDTDKYGSRGEFGELILHAAVKDFFGGQPAVSKIYYKDSPNDTVKGFDCVHVVEANGSLELWIGEVKYYQNLSQAIRDVIAEIEVHLKADFLRREFVAITNKIDRDWPLAQELTDLLDRARSLDEILPRLVVPVMLTYNSPAVASFQAVSDGYVAELRKEAENAWASFVSKLAPHMPIELHLILVPVKNKTKLTKSFHKKLQAWKAI